ncbi:MAG: hypothetical protein IJM44_08325 [Ruminococcus sp.]|nr:hypothetical protein [Ruminococcus sp.]
MSDEKHIIWTNYDLDYEEWRDGLEEEYPELTDDERYRRMLEINNEYLDDERVNLNIQLDEPILVIGDLGLWFGRRSGYKEIESGNIKDCLYSDGDYTTWYVDKDGDLRCDDIHHDGTNHYLYRVWKSSADEIDRDELREKIYLGTATDKDIESVTERLGDEIGRVYGWDFPHKCAVSHDAR